MSSGRTGRQPSDFELETDSQIRAAVEVLHIEGIRRSAWAGLDTNARLRVLQEVENHMAMLQQRPGVSVVAAPLGAGTFGGYDGRRIRINADHLASNMPVEEFVNTIVHEGRHAFQDFAVRHPGFVSENAVVNAWADNMAPGNYSTAEEYGQELYAAQPIEADAWDYADRITEALGAVELEG